MPNYINSDCAYDKDTLIDWFINSVSATDEPIWTDRHIEELVNDFYVVPRNTPIETPSDVKHGKWIEHPHFNFEGGYSGSNYGCSECGYDDAYEELNYCPDCGAKMDKEE